MTTVREDQFGPVVQKHSLTTNVDTIDMPFIVVNIMSETIFMMLDFLRPVSVSVSKFNTLTRVGTQVESNILIDNTYFQGVQTG